VSLIESQEADPGRYDFAGVAASQIPPKLNDPRECLDSRRRPKHEVLVDDIALIRCCHTLLQRLVTLYILLAHQMPPIRPPKTAHHVSAALWICFVPNADEGLNELFNVTHAYAPSG
jgi:hypothetical protein